MLSAPPPKESPDAARLRGHIFTDLDRLAFALEREVEGLIEQGRTVEAETRQHVRLGVRLAQRLVTGVWADEVNCRLEACAGEYEAHLGAVR